VTYPVHRRCPCTTLVGGGDRSSFRLSKVNGERFNAISQVVASVLVLTFVIDLLSALFPGCSPDSVHPVPFISNGLIEL
jgi:hypothetical protein